ncbi:uncharacterized protein LOC113136175 [Mastacembelus armatus]|uniref:uncharacterized protein LOC113136175 n=1 Tax=Mastacembelus armatus TaxID=205130 RepID=UPI000E45B32B|nr:uncharacterized protein LOC113136175 [Mastacembelus armatus]
MASTPSASALSAVLRCRGNIWPRSPPTKRPSASVCSRGLAGGALRENQNQTSACEAFLQRERVVYGGRITVSREPSSVHRKTPKEKDLRKMNRFNYLKPPAHEHSAASGFQNALVRQLARSLTFNLSGIDKCSKIIQTIKYETHRAPSGPPAGIMKVCISFPCPMENEHLQSLVSTLKSTCSSLTALLSEMMLLWRFNSPGDELDALQRNGQSGTSADLTASKDNSGRGQRITEDRPD